MPLPQQAKANPRGQSQVGRSPVIRGQRKGKTAMELRRFARNYQTPITVRLPKQPTASRIKRGPIMGGGLGRMSRAGRPQLPSVRDAAARRNPELSAARRLSRPITKKPNKSSGQGRRDSTFHPATVPNVNVRIGILAGNAPAGATASQRDAAARSRNLQSLATSAVFGGRSGLGLLRRTFSGGRGNPFASKQVMQRIRAASIGGYATKYLDDIRGGNG